MYRGDPAFHETRHSAIVSAGVVPYGVEFVARARGQLRRRAAFLVQRKPRRRATISDLAAKGRGKRRLSRAIREDGGNLAVAELVVDQHETMIPLKERSI